jgi:hypothetical protein
MRNEGGLTMNESLKSCRPQHEEKSMCAVQQIEPPLLDKCKALINLAQEIDNESDALKNKLFNPMPAPCCDTTEPVSVVDFLNLLKDVLKHAHNTLDDLNSRI